MGNNFTPAWIKKGFFNESLFCDDFLSTHQLLYVNGAFFTPDGRVTDTMNLRCEIFDMLRDHIGANIAKRVSNVVDVLKLAAQVEDFPPITDRIALANGTLYLDGTFQEGKPEIVRNRLPVKYDPKAAQPVHWLRFLSDLLYPEDIPTVQEFIGYCLIPSNKGQRMMVIKGSGGEGTTCATAPPNSVSCGWAEASVYRRTVSMRGSTGQLDKEANSMAYITKRGNSYSVRYTYEDEHGKSCDKWESFPTKEEATNRKKQIEHELAAGTFLIPSSVTVAEFLMDWLPKQCSKHKWAPKTYESNLSTIQNLIIPYIGSMEMQKLKPYHMENLYTTLSKTPCGSYIEGKKQKLTEKQKQRFLSGTKIHEVHRLLGTAFQYAVEWGILVKSPVPVDSPKKSTQERTIWTVEEMRAALDSMEDPILHLAVHLTLVGALREGEIVGLTPEDLDFDSEDGIGTFRINKSMQRVRKEALNQVDDGCIIKVFPDKLERSTTSLILKSTKTASSCRTIFMTSALKEELKKWLNQLAADEMKDPTRYHDSGMLFRLPNGLAVEPVLIRKKFLKWQDAHPEFPRIVFHGLQHSSATYQLMISGGDVKAVQGTTGHATADMLVNTYAHIQQSSRVELGKKFEEGFYAKQESPSLQAVPAEGEPTISITALLELLKNADPEVKAQLRLALLT